MDSYVISWAVGHLVGLANPEEYDERLKKWRFADLPIDIEAERYVIDAVGNGLEGVSG